MGGKVYCSGRHQASGMRKKRSLGFGFSDEIAKVAVKSKYKGVQDIDWKDVFIPNYYPDQVVNLQSSIWRVTILLVVSISLFFLLFLRLFYLQIVRGSENRQLADGNRIQVKIIHAPRGVIYDRNGKILASNSPGFRLIDSEGNFSLVSREEALKMEVQNDPRALNLEVDSIRNYPKGEELSHVLGYVREISQEQLALFKIKGYRSGDRLGISGIESQYEDILKGKDGGEIIEVDSTGKKLRTLRVVPPLPGRNLNLTIDSDLQHNLFITLSEAVKKANSCCGAAVAMDPQSGQILSLVSYPSFDNNIFTNPKNTGHVEELFTRSDSPVLNRVVGGTYPPGSTFKIVTSLAALSSGKVTPQTQIEDTGQIFLGPFKFTNWYFTQYGKTEGLVDLTKALQRSNDIYYYRIGQKIGEKIIIEWARKLKMGDKLGLDLDGEVAGLVADNDWKVKNTGELWYPGDTLHLSIGQGFLLATPLQILGATSFIAADGTLYKPQLFLKATSQRGDILKEFKPDILVSKIVSTDQIKAIKAGLEKVPVNGGTAWPFFSFPIPTAGKTGTAEFGDAKNRTHAWYTAYAPADDPKIALTVLVEGGGEGSSVAAPIAKEVLRWFFSPDKNNLIKDTMNVATDSARTLGE